MIPDEQLRLRAAGLTDVGRARERNEDAFLTARTVFAVADGLGGHRAGEVASRLALEPVRALDDGSAEAAARGLADAVRRANRVIFERAQHDSDLRGMGTTLTAIAMHGSTAYLAHVGDSRCYLIRGDRIVQLSQDHTLVARMREEGKLTAEEAESHPQRSVLTRALGAESEVEVDESQWTLVPGDVLLLCSDGLTTVVSDDEMLETVTASDDLDEVCRRLVDEANARGGPDNITVIAVAVEARGDSGGTAAYRPTFVTSPPPVESAPGARDDEPRKARSKRRRERRGRVPTRALLWSLSLLLVLGGLAVGARYWVNSSYYVGVWRERVAIFRGIPTEVFGVRLSSIEQVTGPPLADVAPYFRDRLHEGIRTESLDDARRVASQVPLTEAARRERADSRATPSPSPSPSPSPGAAR